VENSLKIFLLINGRELCGQETQAKDGKRGLKGAAYIELDQTQTRFNFRPIRYFEPEKEFILYDGGIVGEQEMAPMLAERFKLYLRQLEIEAEKQHQEQEEN